jgi:hypothetical protein
LQTASKVILIREKLSRLSQKVTLDTSILMLLEHSHIDKPSISSKIQKIRKIELKSLMDPMSLAEQAVSLNLKLMKWR